MPPDDVDRLYGLPLDEFVSERTALAKRLRGEGRREEATAAGKLTKPTAAAWAANQVLRSQRKDARELLAAGEAVGKAQGNLVAGKGARGGLDEAVGRHRDALGRLTDAAAGLLDSDGRALSETVRERVRETLTAVSLDPDLRGEAEGARLVKERSYAGFGLGALGDVKPAPTKKTPKKTPKKAPKKAKPKKEKPPGPTAAERRKRAKAIERAEREVAAAEERLAAAKAALARLRDAG